MLFYTMLAAIEEFDISKFSDPAKYGWKDLSERQAFRTDLLERQQLLQVYQIKAQPISRNLIKSAIVPGWGQFAVHDYTKGQVFLSLEVVLLGSSIYLLDQSMDKYAKYKDATQVDLIEQYYDDASSPFQYSMAILGLYSIVWLYNLMDTAKSTEAYNAKVWNNTVKEYKASRISVTPKGVEVRF
jgi:hypothetical protein